MRRALIMAVAYAAAGLAVDAPVQPTVPYASYTEFDATPPQVVVQPSAWPWPTNPANGKKATAHPAAPPSVLTASAAPTSTWRWKSMCRGC